MQTAKSVAFLLLCDFDTSDTVQQTTLQTRTSKNCIPSCALNFVPRAYSQAEMHEANGYTNEKIESQVWNGEMKCDCGESNCKCEGVEAWENAYHLTTEGKKRSLSEEGLEEQVYRQHAT
uniref:AlNc14C246G9569 protein n=1 Tax=Albugo laibachii Nc14 TaxID=890382 RepID=F0WT84_9STRA|nr:AlNc14C246G9569 [Albugo laibachii Nc14]|eukprot:CCA24572.1 AlNc14C246G9569 [Albugo laibachii Nc14]